MNKFLENNKAIIVVLLIIAALMLLGNNNPGVPGPMYKNMAMNEMSLDSGMARGVALEEGYSSGEKIRKTANLNLEVEPTDYETTKTKVDEIIVDGLYTNKNEYKSNYGSREYKNYRITIKVPVVQYDSVLEQLKVLGEVKSFSENADDITTQYKDVQAYLDSAIKQKAKVEELLVKAEDIEDIIVIESKLSELQRNIDNYQKQLINMDRQVDYGTIYFSMSEKVSASQIVLQWTGIMDHLRNIVNGFDSVLVFVSSNIGWAVFLLLVLFGYKVFKKN